MEEKVTDVLAQAVKEDPGKVTKLGVVIAVLGLLAMLAPMVAGVAVALLVGFVLLIAGVVRLIFALKCRSGKPGILPVVVGAVTALAGLLMIAHPVVGLTSLTLVIAIYFLVDGTGEIFSALELRPRAGWGWLLFGGIVSVLLGLMIWNQWPLSGAWAIGVLIGIKLLFVGWAIVALGMAARAQAEA